MPVGGFETGSEKLPQLRQLRGGGVAGYPVLSIKTSAITP